MRYHEMMMNGQKKQELILYVVLWAILFAAPAVAVYVGGFASVGFSYDWKSVVDAWELLSMFLAVFAIHNFLLAPLLVYGNKRRWYFPLLAVMLLLFGLYQCYDRPRPLGPEAGRAIPEQMMDMPQRHGEPGRPPHAMEPHPMGHPKDEPPLPFGGKEMVAFLIMSMLIGLNIGAKYYFKTLDERKRMKELERESLDMQLKYLKYQVNPHFFMNTLNNIHALVDIDPEEAKTMIVVLSKLMRYMLYESNRACVPLKSELSFITNYIDLMRIRYTDNVSIDMRMPGQIPDISIPPLLFINFVENAFKHGISYERKSFIDVSVEMSDGEILFVCRNSRKPKKEEHSGGVGLQNVVRRLQLLYGNRYSLKTMPSDDVYEVELRIPSVFKLPKTSAND